VVVGYGDGFAVAYGYHCWSESIFLRVPGGGDDAPVRVHPNDDLVRGPFVFLG